MIKELVKLSNHLDTKGLSKEADYLDAVIRKIADEEPVNVQSESTMIMDNNQQSFKEVAKVGDAKIVMVIESMRGRTDDTNHPFTTNIQLQDYSDPETGDSRIYNLTYAPDNGTVEVASVWLQGGKKTYFKGSNNAESNRNEFMTVFRKATRNIEDESKFKGTIDSIAGLI
tara:strand:+ start:13880 stop:14392 length:513 start_codon:yes stop_codon:yes gene_type:complete